MSDFLPREFWVKNGKLNKVDQPKYRDEIGYNLQQPSWMGSAITANKGLGERDGLKVIEYFAYEDLRSRLEGLELTLQLRGIHVDVLLKSNNVLREQNKILQNGLEAISINDFSGTHNYHAEKTLAKAAAVVTIAEPEKKDTGRCDKCGPYESCYCSWCHSSGETCLACGEGYGDGYEK
jgi:hypothetical protein